VKKSPNLVTLVPGEKAIFPQFLLSIQPKENPNLKQAWVRSGTKTIKQEDMVQNSTRSQFLGDQMGFENLI
jgi:hypothetical protein